MSNHTAIANRRRQTALGNIEDHLRSEHMGDIKALTPEQETHVLKHRKEATLLNERIKGAVKFRKYLNMKPKNIDQKRYANEVKADAATQVLAESFDR